MKDTIHIAGLGLLTVTYEDDGDNFDIEHVASQHGADITALLSDYAMELIQDELTKQSKARAYALRGGE